MVIFHSYVNVYQRDPEGKRKRHEPTFQWRKKSMATSRRQVDSRAFLSFFSQVLTWGNGTTHYFLNIKIMRKHNNSIDGSLLTPN